MTQQGIDGWWLDLIEPEGEPPQAVYYAGKSADIHNTYPLRSFRSHFDYERNAASEGRSGTWRQARRSRWPPSDSF